MIARCMICGAPSAGLGISWPGPRAARPARLVALDAELAAAGRSARVRLCAFGGDCEVEAIARMIRRIGADFPFRGPAADLAPRVAARLGRPAPAAPRPDPTPRPDPAQGSLL